MGYKDDQDELRRDHCQGEADEIAEATFLEEEKHLWEVSRLNKLEELNT